jgi:tetratricopeptide (TPR) repeat protein/photosystem II stability/assembly factor-like uncharacterized protein
MVDHINPYIAGAPVLERRMFFGREDVFEWIENSLTGKYVDHILVIHGQRRVGKTSVLKHLPERLPDRYIPIFIDLQGRVSTSLGRFLGWLAREIVKALNEGSDLDLPRPDRQTFEADPDYFENVFLPQIEDALGDKRLLLTFDEFDTLETTDAQEGLALPFMAILKRLMEAEKINFVFSIGSSGRKLENMQAAYTSFFKQALYRKISFLTERDARELITQPVEGVIDYSGDAVSEILRITSRHPYFVQLICHELFSQCLKRDNWHVSKADVESILDAVIERGTVNLKFVWDEASNLEKWVLASLAQYDEGVDSNQLEKHLKKEHVRFTRQGLESALLHLREKDVVTADNRFVIHLLRLWLRQNRPMEQVREELEEQNPIVTRLLEIGFEYHSNGEHGRAIQSYEEALAVDPENLEIHLGLGNSHLARGDFGRAAAEFEAVLETASDDVVAQKGYCDAYLQLGNIRFEENKLEEAEFAYRQVLTVNPKHEAASSRMAQIHHRRAVSAILGGKQIALNELQSALEYDESRFSELVDDIQGLIAGDRTLAWVLETWARRALAWELWEDARDLFSAYQRVSGDDAAFQERIDDLEERLRQRRMSHLWDRADRLQDLGREQDALHALQEYIQLNPENRGEAQRRIEGIRARLTPESTSRPGRSRLIPFAALGGISIVVASIALVLTLTSDGGSGTAASGNNPPSTPIPSIESATPARAAAMAEETIPPTSAPTGAPTPTAIPLRWSRIDSGLFLPRDTVNQIVMDPEDSDIVYAGTENSGIYKSINGGLTWEPAQLGLGGGTVHTLAIDPTNPDVLYAGILDAGVYKSTDGGLTWKPTMSDEGLLSNMWQLTSAVTIDPQDPRHLLFLAGWDVYESTDAGASWERIWSTEGCVYATIAFAPDGENVFMDTYFCDDPSDSPSLLRSQDDGRTWEMVYELDTDSGFIGDHFYFNSEAGIVYDIDTHPILASADEGETWSPIENDHCPGAIFAPSGRYYCSNLFSESQVRPAVIHPNDQGTAYVGGVGIFKTVDGGSTWQEVSNGIGNIPTQIKVSPFDGLIYLEENRTYNGDKLLYVMDPPDGDFEMLSQRGNGLDFGLEESSLYRFREQDGLIWVSSDGGQTFSSTGLSTTGEPMIGAGVLTAAGREVFYVSLDDNSLHFSHDLGATWERAASNTGHAISRIQQSSIDGELLYAQTAVVYKSGNGGQSWIDCLQNLHSLGYWLPDTYTALALHPENKDEFFVATKSEGLLHAPPATTCTNMKPVAGGLDNDFPRSVVISPGDPNIVYVGTNGGFYISFDGGESWGQVNDGLLGALSIYSIAVDPNHPELIYASTPYGVFALEPQ